MPGNTPLDHYCKKILAFKIILAWILKACLPEEFEDYTHEEIASDLIEGSPSVSEIPVHAEDAASQIVGDNTEDVQFGEGKVTYDISFRVRLPKQDRIVTVHINVEAQSNYYPGYPMMDRSIYYIGRMISAERGPVFTGDDYHLDPVVSIWIFLDPPKSMENSITSYSLTPTFLVGQAALEREEYDKIKIVNVYLGPPETAPKGSEGDMLHMLDEVLRSPQSPKEVFRKLESNWNLQLDSKQKTEVETMLGLEEMYKKFGREESAKELEKSAKELEKKDKQLAEKDRELAKLKAEIAQLKANQA